MPGMRRGDRKTSNDDNSNKYPHSRQKEPVSTHELKQRLTTVQSQRDEWQQRAKENEEAAKKLTEWQPIFEANETRLALVSKELQCVQFEVFEWQEKAAQHFQLFQEEQQNHQKTLILYNEEKARSSELLIKYDEVQRELKFERRSKASIKGWETRRKRENERLKQEISEMVVLLQNSLERKEEAVNNLYILAERMDRIQTLVDSVEDETNNTPVGLLQKFRQIWLAIKDILSN